MGVEKMSVSFDLDLGEAIRTSATEQSQSVSAWLAAAALDRLRNDALGDAMRSWEKRFGRITADELAEADRMLERAARRGRRGVA